VPAGPPGLADVRPGGVVTGVPDPSVFAATDAAMSQRIRQAGLSGGYLLIATPDQVLYEKAYGGVGRQTPLAVASTSKWLTSALALSYVDAGSLTLDEPISRWLPEFNGAKAGITLRQLLNHTSGIKQQSCIFDTSGVLANCVKQLAAGPLELAPGTQFAYGNGSYHVVARLAEVAGGKDFATLFAERIGGPLGMTRSVWSGGATRNPSPAAGVRTTVEDESRFLRMLLGGGVFEGRRVLSEASVVELQRNQVAGYKTSHDYAVGITRIPTYSLGAWRDVADDGDRTVVISGNGATGFYPWVDHATGTYGIVGVEDQRGAEVAVPASKKVVDTALAAVTRLP
jgi:CubicO group peptidase (beta-lactamase class C family)